MRQIKLNSLNRFTGRTANYVKYRPGYPINIIEFFKEELSLTRENIFADIGSGTGIFTELLINNGNTVYAVEPNDEMRLAAENILGKNKNFISINGKAENTTLKNSCVDFITSAQAFHWFDWNKARLEFKRILKENGRVILIWNSRINGASGFMISFEKFVSNYSVDYNQVNHNNINEDVFKKFFSSYEVKNFSNFQELDFEGLKGRVLSASYMPMEGHPQYEPMIIELERIFNEHKKGRIVKMIYKTDVYYGKLS